MTTVYLDSAFDDRGRLERLYNGDVFVHRARPSSVALADFAMQLIADAFAPYAPREAQFHMPVEEWVARFAPVKPLFIHHERTRAIMEELVGELGCDPDDTYLDVPRLRGVTSDGYLTAGVGYAHHPHRDTWYSAPMSQINWWLPLHDLVSEASMAFHHNYFPRAIRNGSAAFDYYEWNAVGRKDAAQHVASDTRKQPKAEEELDLDDEARYIPEKAGVLAFSAAQLHATVPNTSGLARFSIDFRTVSRADVLAGRGAPNVDSSSTGTSLRDFVSVGNGARFTEDEIAPFETRSNQTEGVLLFAPEGSQPG
ncbi:MAG TPA: hypothetical protein VGP92_00765 [Acidimicrobiia bacterium]|nr:hypothetical protein [Acidimicrobiia bacterium]